MNKRELRKEILALRNALSEQERCEKSNQIVEVGKIEKEPHDMRVDYIVTESKLLGEYR